jgi:predicted nucleic acid-binding protein
VEERVFQELHARTCQIFGEDARPLSNHDFVEAIASLKDRGSIVSLRNESISTLELSRSAAAFVYNQRNDIENRYKAIIQDTFAGSGLPRNTSEQNFWSILSYIFSTVSSTLIFQLLNKRSLRLQPRLLEEAIASVMPNHDYEECEQMRGVLWRFFARDDDRFDSFRWIIAQNYYYLKLLGLDENARILARDLLADSTIFLDTNVLVHALHPVALKHHLFQSFMKGCAELNITVNAASISLFELSKVSSYQVEQIQQYWQFVQKELSSQIHSDFYQIYCDSDESERSDIDKLFKNYLNPEDVLVSEYAINTVDDEFFRHNRYGQGTQRLKNIIIEEYERQRGITKTDSVATHDALLVRWADYENRKTGKLIIIVTYDSTLPEVLRGSGLEGSSDEARILSLETLLQWMAPFLVETDANGLASVFSSAIREQFFPPERIFSLADFSVFKDLDVDSAALPAEDIANFILESKARFVNFAEPRNLREREEHMRFVRNLMQNPGTRYKETVRKLKNQNYHLRLAREDLLEEAKTLEARVKELEAKDSGASRLGLSRLYAAVLFVVVAIGTFFLIDGLGSGTTLFAKVRDVWGLAIIPLLATLAYLIFLHKDEEIGFVAFLSKFFGANIDDVH